MMPITIAKSGETHIIKKITGSEKIRGHLAEMGFVMDAEVTLVNQIGGNVIISIKGSRVALDESIANKILI